MNAQSIGAFEQFDPQPLLSKRAIFIGALVIGLQLFAFIVLAEGQVAKAELRDAHRNMVRTAMAHCLQSPTRASMDACMAGLDLETPADGAALAAAYSDAAAASLDPVSFAMRQ